METAVFLLFLGSFVALLVVAIVNMTAAIFEAEREYRRAKAAERAAHSRLDAMERQFAEREARIRAARGRRAVKYL